MRTYRLSGLESGNYICEVTTDERGRIADVIEEEHREDMVGIPIFSLKRGSTVKVEEVNNG